MMKTKINGQWVITIEDLESVKLLSTEDYIIVWDVVAKTTKKLKIKDLLRFLTMGGA
jgi:hypothetical protein